MSLFYRSTQAHVATTTIDSESWLKIRDCVPLSKTFKTKRMYTFYTPYSKLILGTTIAGMLLMHGIFMFCMGGMARHSVDALSFYLYLLLFIVSIFIVLYAFLIQIKKVTLSNTHLTLHRRMGRVSIPLDCIQSVERKENIIEDIRPKSIAFFFGHYGTFQSKTLGPYHAYVKDPQQMLAIHTSTCIHVFSCERCEELMHLINTRIQQL